VPKTVKEALKLDKNDNTLWADAIAKEMKDVRVAFKILPASEVVTKMILMGHPVSSCHVPVVSSYFIFFQTLISS
jgi:hypothetical protein